MIGSKNLMSVEDDQLRQMVMAVANEEVSPKHVSTIAIPLFEGRYAESNPRLTGVGWLFSEDRPTKKPRVLMSESTVGNMSATQPNCERNSADQSPSPSKSSNPLSLSRRYAGHLGQAACHRESTEFEAALKQMSIDGFLDFPFKFLEGKTPRESSSSNPAMKTKLLAICFIGKGWEARCSRTETSYSCTRPWG